jgi:hypothetical protein
VWMAKDAEPWRAVAEQALKVGVRCCCWKAVLPPLLRGGGHTPGCFVRVDGGGRCPTTFPSPEAAPQTAPSLARIRRRLRRAETASGAPLTA